MFDRSKKNPGDSTQNPVATSTYQPQPSALAADSTQRAVPVSAAPAVRGRAAAVIGPSIFLLGAAYTHKHNGHVRIDVIYGHLSARAQAWIDIAGTLLFLLPLCGLLVMLSWPALAESYLRHELSPDAGGLLRWPVRLLTPLGFALLTLQGISELIKRAAFLAGHTAPVAERPVEKV